MILFYAHFMYVGVCTVGVGVWMMMFSLFTYCTLGVVLCYETFAVR